MSLPSPRPPALPSSALTFHLIPHTHWDREWYLTRAAFQARLVPVLDEVLDQLERDGDARFVLDGQTVLLEDYLAVKPENGKRIAALVQRGALEIGPWYVLSDLLIPSAESLRRNLAEGMRDAQRFGRRVDVLYSPDAFGHPAELPKLAAEFGIKWAVIRRGLGRPGGRDRDLYRWEAPTGERLLVYHLPAAGYDVAIDLGEPGVDLGRTWAPIRQQLIDRAVCDQIAVFLGADHHAMVRDVGRLRDGLQALEVEHRVRVSGLAEFFAAVEGARPDAPSGRGELRRIDGHTWVLQDAHATRARIKRRLSRVELLLVRIAEPLARLATERGGRDRGGLLRLAWRTLLQSQFHDTLAGTTSDEVQNEQDVRLDAVSALVREIATASLAEVCGSTRVGEPDAPRLVLWNPCDRVRSGILTAALTVFRSDVLVGPPSGREPRTGPGHEPFALHSESGERIPVQVLAVRRDQERRDDMRRYPDQDEVDRVWVAFQAPELPGLAHAALTPRPARLAPPAEGLDVARDSLANRLVQVTVSSGGELTLDDRRTGERYPGLCRLEDEPDTGDLYTFSRGSRRASREARPVSRSILARGPLVGAIETRWRLQAAGSGEIGVRQVVSLLADSPVVRIRLDLENSAHDHRLRAWFPVGTGYEALAGTALGFERRRVVETDAGEEAIEQPSRTAPAQRFVAAGADTRGLAVLAPGFFQYEWTADRRIAVTLIRAVGELAQAGLPERPGRAAWPLSTPAAQETGRHTIELALVPADSAAALEPDRLIQDWEDAFLPVQAVLFR